MFLRRGVSGVPVMEVHTLELIEGGWRLLGGGGGPGDEATEPRPRLADGGALAVSHGGGGTARARHGWLGFGRGGRVSYKGIRLAAGGALAVSHGGGGTARTRHGWLGFGRDGWISYTELRLAEEVAALRVADRLLPVARHGSAVVVWTRRPPRVSALDASGTVLGWIPL